MKEWFFHVRHNARPETVKEVLLLLEEQEGISLPEMLILGAARGYTIGTTAKSVQSIKENPLQVARDLSLIDSEQLILTSLGRNVVNLLAFKPKIANEVLHFLYYTAWTPQYPELSCFSWTYKTLCNFLWDTGTSCIDRVQLADQISNLAKAQFQIDSIALSERSTEAVLKWVGALEPPLLTEKITEKRKVKEFSRRTFCPPETFVLAVDYVYRLSRIGYQTNILLDTSKQEAICKVCLLDPAEFDNVLEWACGQYDFLSQGSSGGWGRYVVLARPPTLIDFMG